MVKDARIRGRARLDVCNAAYDAAVYLTALVPTTSDNSLEPGELVTRARRARVHALRLLDNAVLCELASGTTWEQLAEALSLPSEVVRERYEAHWERFLNGESAPWPPLDGVAAVPLTSRTAADLDEWYARVAGDNAPIDAVSAGLP